MSQLNYKELLSKSFGRVLGVLIGLSGLSFLTCIIMHVLLEIKLKQEGVLATLPGLSIVSSSANNIVVIVMWLVFLLFLKSKHDKAEHILVSILKIVFGWCLFNLILTFLSFVLKMLVLQSYDMSGLMPVVMYLMKLLASALMVAIYYFIINCYSRKLNKETVSSIFYGILVFILIKNVLVLYGLVDAVIYLAPITGISAYLALNNLVFQFFELITSILWMIIIWLFAKNIQYYKDPEEKEELPQFNSVLRNALSKFHLIGIAVLGLTIQFGVLVTAVINQIKEIVVNHRPLELIYEALFSPVNQILVLELVLFVYLMTQVYQKGKSLLAPVFGLALLYLYNMVFSFGVLIYYAVKSGKLLDTTVIFNLIPSILVAVLMLIFFVFIVLHYHKPVYRNHIELSGYGLIGSILINFCFNLINQNSLTFTAYPINISTGKGALILITGLIISLSSLIFWAGLPLTLNSELNKHELKG